MAKFNVVMVATDLGPTPAWVVRQLEEQGIKFVEQACANPSEVAAAAQDADVVWVMGGSPVVTADVLPQLRRCRTILRTGTGTDNIPVDAAARLGITVANTPEATMHEVAEHTIGLLFAVVRQIAVQDRLVRQGTWDRNRAWPRLRLAGRTLGLVGFGRIARLVAKKTGGMEMSRLAFDPAVDESVMAELGVASVSLEELLARSDFVSIHVPLCEGTYHLIGEAELRRMKPEAILLNTARGPVIDEPALIRALQEGWIAGAGLDVAESEPLPPQSALLKLDNVVLTPHIAACSEKFVESFWTHSVQTLIEMSKQRAPLWRVTPSDQNPMASS